MPKDCCVKSCKEHWIPNTHLSFFAFPFNNEEMKEKWIKASPGFKTLSKHSVICSNHFLRSDYNIFAGKKLLKKNTVPSLFGIRCSNGCVHPLQIPDPSAGYDQGYNAPSEMNITRPQMITVLKIGDQGRNHVAQICSSHLPGFQSYESPGKRYASVTVQTCPRLSGPSDRERELQQKIKILQARLRRRDKMITNIKELVANLKKNCQSANDLEKRFLRKFTQFDLELFKNEATNNCVPKNGKTYTKEMKDFAVTLYSYSPRAYKFVRAKINLPHMATIRRWVAESINDTKKDEAQNSVVESNQIEKEGSVRIEEAESMDIVRVDSADTEKIESIEMDESSTEIQKLEISHSETRETNSFQIDDGNSTEIAKLEFQEIEEEEVRESAELEEVEFTQITEVESIRMERVKSTRETGKSLGISGPTVLITFPVRGAKTQSFRGTLKRYVMKTEASSIAKVSRTLSSAETVPKH